MPTIVDKERAVALLRDEFGEIADLGSTLDERAWNTPTCLPGWTVKDNLSHMVGTESALAGEAMPTVDLPDLDYIHNDIAKLNEQWVASMRPVPGHEVLERFRSVTRDRLAELDAMTQAGFDAPSWTPAGPDETYGRFMRIRHYDCFLHEHDMRLAVGTVDRTDVEPLRFALEEVLPALGYAVGRKAAMPKGSRVRIRLTGALDDEEGRVEDGREESDVRRDQEGHGRQARHQGDQGAAEEGRRQARREEGRGEEDRQDEGGYPGCDEEPADLCLARREYPMPVHGQRRYHGFDPESSGRLRVCHIDQ